MTQKLPTENNNEHIADQLVEEIKARKERGIATYGVALQSFNGRDSTQDALEEALDMAHYIKQWQIERRELIDFVHDAYTYSDIDSILEEKSRVLLKKLGEFNT